MDKTKDGSLEKAVSRPLIPDSQVNGEEEKENGDFESDEDMRGD